jgi:hypothetical protein
MAAIILHRFLALFVPLLLLVVVAVTAQEGGACDSANMQTVTADYIDCITTSPGCIDCDASSGDSMPDFSGGGTVPATNDDIEALFCNAVNCCSACVEQARAFLQCSAEGLCVAFGITDCSLECPPETYPYGDSDTVPDECDQAAGALASCIVRDGSCFLDDEQCAASLDELEAATSNAAADYCAFAESYYCTYVGCCPNCQDELRAVYECESSGLEGCTLTCADAIVNGDEGEGGDDSNPTATTTDPPAAAPTNNDPNSSNGSPSSLASPSSGPSHTAVAIMASAVVLARWVLL